MRDRRDYREIAPEERAENGRRFDRERIILALIGLAGALVIISMNMR